MKKTLLLWTIACIYFLTSLSAFAASVPERSGTVTDPAGLFSHEERRTIEQALSGREYAVVVLTATGLGEREGEQLANDAYDVWGLGSHELMLVITTDPNYVHLVFENEQLAARVAASAARDVKGVLDLAFVPLAADGRLADGVIAVSDYVQELPPASNAVPSPPVQDGRSPASPGSLPPSEAETGSGTSGKYATLSGTAVFLIFAIAGLVVAALFALNRWIRVRRTRELLERVKSLHGEGSSLISKLMVSDLFKELEMGFIQGETKRRTEELEQQVLQLYNVFQQTGDRLHEQRATWRTASAVARSAEDSLQEIERNVRHAEQLAEEIAELKKLALEVRRRVEQAKLEIVQKRAELDRLVQETGHSLHVPKQQLDEIMTLLEQADRIDEFDFLQAEQVFTQLRKKWDEYEAGLRGWKEHRFVREQLANVIETNREHLQRLVRQERLNLHDGDPFALLLEAGHEWTRAESHIDAGDVRALAECIARIERLLKEAHELIETMIRRRDEAKETLRQIRAFLSGWDAFAASYERDEIALRSRYAEVHLREQHARFERLTEQKRKLETQQQELEHLSDDAVQHYERAERVRAEASALLKHMQDEKAAAVNFLKQLDHAKRNAEENFEINRRLFYNAEKLMEALKGDPGEELLRAREDAQIRMRSCDEALRREKIDLGEAESRLNAMKSSVDRFVQMVERLYRLQEEALKSLERLQRDYQRRIERYGHHVPTDAYNQKYRGMTSAIEQMILAGMFAEAMKRIGEGQSLLKQMDRDYQRYRRDHMGPPGGPFGGGPFGGGRSGGSSGWGGGGRSGGSSSWGGGGGRSSGSSGWGRGGRSGGSSKW